MGTIEGNGPSISELSKFVSPELTAGTGGKKGKAYAEQIFNNLKQIAATKLERIEHKILNCFRAGTWINDATVYRRLQKELTDFSELYGKLKGELSQEQIDAFSIQLREIDTVCGVLKHSGIGEKKIEVLQKNIEIIQKAMKQKAEQECAAAGEKCIEKFEESKPEKTEGPYEPVARPLEKGEVTIEKTSKEEPFKAVEEKGLEEVKKHKAKRHPGKSILLSELKKPRQLQVDGLEAEIIRKHAQEKTWTTEELGAMQIVPYEKDTKSSKQSEQLPTTSEELREEISNNLKGIVTAAQKYPAFTKTLGKWLGKWSAENTALGKYAKSDFARTKFERIQGDVENVHKLIAKGFGNEIPREIWDFLDKIDTAKEELKQKLSEEYSETEKKRVESFGKFPFEESQQVSREERLARHTRIQTEKAVKAKMTGVQKQRLKIAAQEAKVQLQWIIGEFKIKEILKEFDLAEEVTKLNELMDRDYSKMNKDDVSKNLSEAFRLVVDALTADAKIAELEFDGKKQIYYLDHSVERDVESLRQQLQVIRQM